MDKIIKLTPAIKDYVWGGEKLKKYGKHADTNIAETWELSFHKDGLCLDENGMPFSTSSAFKLRALLITPLCTIAILPSKDKCGCAFSSHTLP